MDDQQMFVRNRCRLSWT